MARDFDGSNDNVQESAASDVIEGATSVSVAFWVWPDNFTVEYKLVSQWNGNFDQSTFLVNIQAGVPAGKVGFLLTANASSQDSDRRTSTALTTGQWNHVVCTWSATDTFTFYINGVSSTPETWLTSEGIAAVNGSVQQKLTIGEDASLTGDLDGKMAEIGIWKNRVLTAADAVGLSKGFVPLFYPSGLVFYTSLLGNNSPEIDYKGGRSLTVSGTTKFDHPKVIYPSPAQIRKFITSAATPAIARYYRSLMGVGI